MMIKARNKGFSVIEFLVASMLTVGVVASSTLAIGIAQRTQQMTYYKDLSYQIANSIIQASRIKGCGMATGNPIYDTAMFNNCTAYDNDSGISQELNLPGGLAIPSVDGLNYVYSPNANSTDVNRLKLKIILRTSWLQSDNMDNSATACSVNSAPNLFRRSITVITMKNNQTVAVRKFIDFQAIDTFSTKYDPTKNGYILKKNLPTGIPTVIELPSISKKIYRLPDSGNCVLFPFIPLNSVVTVTVNRAPQSPINIANAGSN